MLLSELLPRHLRGQGLFTHTLAMLLGFLLSAVANQALHPYAWGWRASNALLAAPAAAMAALLPFVGESPQVLCQRGDKEAARAVSRGGCIGPVQELHTGQRHACA
jgi:MFS family permease